ncbi:hypothetical protein D3C76_554290 [compost metagenome]
MAPCKIMQPLHQRMHSIIAALTAEPVGQPYKYSILSVFGNFSIFLFQQLLQQLLAHHLRLMLIQYPEARIDGDELVITPDHLQAKGMQRRNRSSAKQGKLTAQMLIAMASFLFPGVFFLQLPFQCLADALPHFSSRCFGKGSHQQPVHTEPVLLIADFPDNPLHQHRCFAGARRRRDQDIVTAPGNGAPLVIAPQASFRLGLYFSFPYHGFSPPSRDSRSQMTSLPGLPRLL